MKKRILVFLVILALLAVGGQGLVAAQSGTAQRAVALEAVTLYDAPGGGSVASLAASTIVTVTKTDETGGWLYVEAADGAGYAPAGSFLMLDYPLLSHKAVISSANEDGFPVLSAKELESEPVAALKYGDVVDVLTEMDNWFVVAADGKVGWMLRAAVPPGFSLGVVSPGDAPELGIYAEADLGSSIVTTVPNGSQLYVGAADGQWASVITLDGVAGWVLGSSVVALPNTSVETDVNVKCDIYDDASRDANLLVSLPNNVMLTFIEAVDEEWFEVYHPDFGFGYAMAPNLTPVYPLVSLVYTDAKAALVDSGDASEVGLFAEQDFGSDLVATVPGGQMVYIVAEDELWSSVMAMDGSSGWALASTLAPLPMVMVEPIVGGDAQAGVYAGPDFASDVLGVIDAGVAVYYMGPVDDSWMEIYDPVLGMGYVLTSYFSGPYSVATVQVGGAVVREGPNDTIYNAVAELPAGTQVIVKGKDSSSDWIQVSIPFAELDYGYNGVDGWMRSFLFVDADNNTDLDASYLVVTAE
ncbi:MAG: hypothetical protein JXJ20_07895 [Anaerolineae bacterium]|jgi:SH3-like domain-containing protein|nr:hypothetical protein [Anaerolineae bacterium]